MIKRFCTAMLLTMLVIAPAAADYDAAMEAREQAQREAARKAAAQKQREMDQQRAAAKAKQDSMMLAEKRKVLGPAASGKSDAEIDQLYDAKVKRDTAAAHSAMQSAQSKTDDKQMNDAARQVTGKSIQEMQNMSDAELEKLSRDLEKKYSK
jgi:hypothetical protein